MDKYRGVELMVPTAYIDEYGIHAPTYTEIIDGYKQEWRNIWGEDLYLEPDSQEGQALVIAAKALHDANQMAVAVYQSLSPQTAIGVGLSQSVKINGLTRKEASRSTADVRIVGQAYTQIVNGIVTDAAGNKWDLPAIVNIPEEGEIIVTVTAQESGAINAQAGEISRIFTPTRGWQTVSNPAAAIPGQPMETDAELRFRQSVSVSLPSMTVFDAIIASVLRLDGVTAVKGYENDTSETDSNGIPGHSICICVIGGDVQEIGNTIINKKTPGTGLYGNTSVTVDLMTGNQIECKFTRPESVTVNATLKITVDRYFQSADLASIETAVANAINGTEIGEDLILNSLYCAAYSVNNHYTITDFQLNDAYNNVTVDFDEKIVAGTVTVNVNQ